MKKFRKNILCMLTVGAVAFGLMACGGKSTSGSEAGTKAGRQ